MAAMNVSVIKSEMAICPHCSEVFTPDQYLDDQCWGCWVENNPDIKVRRLGKEVAKALTQAKYWEDVARSGATAEILQDTKRAVAVTIDKFIQHRFPDRSNLLEPWLPASGLALVFAERGLGKTFFCLEIAIAVASGKSALHWKAPQPRGVLYIDGEMPGGLLQDRLCSMIAAKGITGFKKLFKIMTPDLQPHGMPHINTVQGQALIEEHLDGIDLVIVDNISTLAYGGAAENEAESWELIQSWALRQRAVGRTVLFVHHAGKNGEQRGTSKREDAMDTVIQLKPCEGVEHKEGAQFEVHFRKARRCCGDDILPVEVKLITDAKANPTWVVRSLEESTMEKVAKLLKLGISQKDICIELGLAKSTVSYHTHNAKRAGLVP